MHHFHCRKLSSEHFKYGTKKNSYFSARNGIPGNNIVSYQLIQLVCMLRLFAAINIPKARTETVVVQQNPS
jgi:hypothetical protein